MQLQNGDLFGTVVDEQGQTLPGVTTTLTGQGTPVVQATDAQGRFRYLDLMPGPYALSAELEGFAPARYPDVVIRPGRNTGLEVTLKPAVSGVVPS